MRDFAAQPYPSTYVPLPRRDTLIRGATVLDGTGRRLEATDVLLRDGRRRRDRPAASTRRRASDDRRRGRALGDARHRRSAFAPRQFPDAVHGRGCAAHRRQRGLATRTRRRSGRSIRSTCRTRGSRARSPAASRRCRSCPGRPTCSAAARSCCATCRRRTVQGMIFPGAPFGLKMACGENVVHAYGDSGRFPVSRMGAVSGQRAAWIAARKYLHDWRRYADGRGAPAARAGPQARHARRRADRRHPRARALLSRRRHRRALRHGARVRLQDHRDPPRRRGVQDPGPVRAGRRLRGRVVGLVGLQARGLRRDPRKRRVPRRRGRLRGDALGFRHHRPAPQHRGREGDGGGRACRRRRSRPSA